MVGAAHERAEAEAEKLGFSILGTRRQQAEETKGRRTTLSAASPSDAAEIRADGEGKREDM